MNSSAVIHTLLHDQGLSKDCGNSAAIAFFYFDFKDKERYAVERGLRRIILQLSTWSPYRYRALEAQYKLSNGQTLPTYEDLQHILEELLQELGRTYIIFDALDECEKTEQKRLVEVILRLQKWTKSPLHLLFTSQPLTVFSDSFKDVTCVHLESAVTHKDIELFVEIELREMKTWASRVDEIVVRVVHKSSGMSVFS
jgi:hypothetical protein